MVSREYGTPPTVTREVLDAATNRLGAYVYEKFYESKTSEWCAMVASQSASSMADDPSINDLPKSIRILMGDHWLLGRPSYRASPVVNKCLRYWLELQSTISDVRLNSYVHSDVKEYADVSKMLTQMSAANWQEEDGDTKLMATVQHASLSIGYTKVGPRVREDDICETFLPCGPDSVTPIMPSLYDIQDSGGVIYKCWKPLSWFWNRYSFLARDIQPEATGWHRSFPARPYHIPEYTWNSMNPQLRAFFGSNDTDGKGRDIDQFGRVPMALLREFWFQDDRINTSNKTLSMGWGNFAYFVRPGYPLYPYGRLICTAQDENPIVLYDGPNPRWHGMYPFPELRLRPVVWLFAGLSIFQDLFPINQAVNQLLADLQDYLKQILNPTTVVRDGSMSPDAWDDYYPGKPGQKLTMVNRNDPIGQVLHFERPDPGGIGVIPNAIQMLLKLFDEQAGLIDSGSLVGKKQVPSGDTVEQIQNIRQSLFRLMTRYVVSHMRKVGVMQISDILQNYDRKKMVSYFGEEAVLWQNFDSDTETYVPRRISRPETFEWNPGLYQQYIKGDLEPYRRGRMFVQSFKQKVDPGGGLPAQRQAMAVMASGLNARGRLSTKSLYEILAKAGYPMPDWNEEEMQIKKEMAELPQGKPPKGRPQKAG